MTASVQLGAEEVDYSLDKDVVGHWQRELIDDKTGMVMRERVRPPCPDDEEARGRYGSVRGEVLAAHRRFDLVETLRRDIPPDKGRDVRVVHRRCVTELEVEFG